MLFRSMYGAFRSTPDLTPFDAVPNQVPLTEGVVTAPSCGLDTLGRSGAAARRVTAAAQDRSTVPADMVAVAKAWERWRARQHFTGESAVPDLAHPQQMNRWTWYQTHQWSEPYPGDSRIYRPSEVPGGYLPGADTE